MHYFFRFHPLMLLKKKGFVTFFGFLLIRLSWSHNLDSRFGRLLGYFLGFFYIFFFISSFKIDFFNKTSSFLVLLSNSLSQLHDPAREICSLARVACILFFWVFFINRFFLDSILVRLYCWELIIIIFFNLFFMKLVVKLDNLS